LVAAWIYVLPRLGQWRPQTVLLPILLLHSFRHLGLMFLAPGATDVGLPLQFARPAAFGDLLAVPCKGLIGPWAHLYPHDGVPGPAIGFLQEALRWWDQWLKGNDTGIMAEPVLRVWMQESVRPRPFHKQRTGRWVAETQWPSPRITLTRYWLNPDRLSSLSTEETQIDFCSPQTTGLGELR
jgi:hypothetical protein